MFYAGKSYKEAHVQYHEVWAFPKKAQRDAFVKLNEGYEPVSAKHAYFVRKNDWLCNPKKDNVPALLSCHYYDATIPEFFDDEVNGYVELGKLGLFDARNQR